MFVMGDEVRRTQGGNNNAYCQDDETAWFDWDDPDRHGDVLAFVQRLLRFRVGSRFFRDERYWRQPGGTDIVWHGVDLHRPDWGDTSHSLAFELVHTTRPDQLYVALNAYWEDLDFEIPPAASGQAWLLGVDTAAAPPDDVPGPPTPIDANAGRITVAARSVVVLGAIATGH